ncbi:3-deoxy-D-manno-octulosonic acid transferase [Mesonia aquimarina]|uniref:3-deoxy-D-manno-octulosonic acid transferase n=1 Tax=Mesonia aquimarina TaxID=1504967 RepID=UPI000EF5682C|nr:glycosyltransferase N-terminal domain-containing protein [Mesonia aquimarina]
MRTLYSILITLFEKLLPLIALFNPKMKLFYQGRKKSFSILEEKVGKKKPVIWMHAASLGEYEQGVPVLEKLKENFPEHQILITFFSPSGYEIKKNSALADVVTYLPLDTKSNAKKFVEIVQPEIALFIKYEIWPNLLFELQKKSVNSILVSGVFRKNQIYFKAYGKFMLKALHTFQHLFVQEENSKKLLNTFGFKNVSVSGDTRFDRVSRQLDQKNELTFLDNFKDQKTCVICGSTWPEDEEILVSYINNTSKDVKFVIAPHQINSVKIKALQKKLTAKSIRFSEYENQNLKEAQVFILDTIGLLTKAYSYATIAYVGGAMGTTGLHNILEPATFGVPIVIGKNYLNFPEAIALQKQKGLFSVDNQQSLQIILDRLITDNSFRQKSGRNAKEFINSQTGATVKIVKHISNLLSQS